MRQNKIEIFGPEDDGSYSVEFRLADGRSLVLAAPRGSIDVAKHFQALIPSGLVVEDAATAQKTRSYFRHRIDMWDAAGDSIIEHLAGVDDFGVAVATYRAAVARWPKEVIMLRQGARLVHDSRRGD